MLSPTIMKFTALSDSPFCQGVIPHHRHGSDPIKLRTMSLQLFGSAPSGRSRFVFRDQAERVQRHHFLFIRRNDPGGNG